MRENLQYKLIAVGIAFFVWAISKQATDPVQMSFFSPVAFKNLGSQFQVTAEPAQVNISVETQSRGNLINPLEIQAILDLSNVSEGTFDYTLTESNIQAPSHVRVARITPAQVRLTIEELVEKQVPVRARYQGRVAKGYLLDSVSMDPESITIRGTREELERLEEVMTSEIDLRELSSDTEFTVQLDLPKQDLQVIEPQGKAFIAHVRVKGLPLKKRFDNVPIYLRNTTYVSLINPSAFNVFLEGPADLINELSSEELYGVVDVESFGPGSYKVTPEVVLPEEVALLQQWPTVSLWVKSERLSQ
ncbi:MAG: YbbR-like domain-containing protein [bacterium]|jgi:YbbR domain-containing protein